MRGAIRSSRRLSAAHSFLLYSLCVLGSLSIVLVIGPGLASAEESWGYDLGHELMSPYCPGRTLATCPSPQAAELVQWIVTQEAAGATKQQVLEMLVDRFGEDILGAPPAEGFTLWAYILPVAAFVIGGGLAFVVLRRVVRGTNAGDPLPMPAGRSATPDGQPLTSDTAGIESDEDLARIVDSELQRRA